MTFWHHFPAKIRLQIIFSQIPSHPSFPGKNNHFFMVLQLSPYYFFCMRKLRILRIFVLFPQFYAGYFLNFLNFLTSIFCSGTFGTLALSLSIVPIVPLVPCDFFVCLFRPDLIRRPQKGYIFLICWLTIP